jgi:hypothetical protein
MAGMWLYGLIQMFLDVGGDWTESDLLSMFMGLLMTGFLLFMGGKRLVYGKGSVDLEYFDILCSQGTALAFLMNGLGILVTLGFTLWLLSLFI